MTTQNIDGKTIEWKDIVNGAYQGAIVVGLTVGVVKLSEVFFRKEVPKLSAYDFGVVVVEFVTAWGIKELLVQQGASRSSWPSKGHQGAPGPAKGIKELLVRQGVIPNVIMK